MPDPMEISDNLLDAALSNPAKDGASECSLPGIVAKALGWETCWEAPHRPGFWMLERPLPDYRLEAIPLEAELHRLLSRRKRSAEQRVTQLERALLEIAEGKGRFSRDPLTHASNTIEEMKGIAQAALSGQPAVSEPVV